MKTTGFSALAILGATALASTTAQAQSAAEFYKGRQMTMIISTGPGFTAFGLIALPTADSGGLFGTAAEKAYILYGLLVGVAFGPVQASARSYLARSVHPDEAGRYFGLYALSGRATSFAAPLSVGLVTTATGSARLGMAALVVFLLVGLILLIRTPYPADRPV